MAAYPYSTCPAYQEKSQEKIRTPSECQASREDRTRRARAEQCHCYTESLTNRHEVVSQSVAQEQRPTCERMGAQQVAETRGGAHASKHWYGTRQIISSATRTLPSGVTSRGDLPATAQPAPGQSPLPTSLASSSFPSPPRSPHLLCLLLSPSPRARTIGFLITHPTETVLCSHTTPLLPLQGRPARPLAASSRLESVPAWCVDRPRVPTPAASHGGGGGSSTPRWAGGTRVVRASRREGVLL